MNELEGVQMEVGVTSFEVLSLYLPGVLRKASKSIVRKSDVRTEI